MEEFFMSTEYKRPKDLLIYYGWLNSFNNATNSWDNEKVAQEMAKYDLIVLGDGIQDSGHGDYSNTSVIIPRVKELNTNCKIFGYVTVNQTLTNFEDKADDWDTLEIDGIFMDEAGYDYGKTRSEFNDRVDHVHGLTYAKLCFANAWNLDHILGTENDASYPNTTYNSSSTGSNLTENDYALLESFPINTTAYSGNNGYESKTDWLARGEKAVGLRNSFNINLVGSGIISDGHGSETNLFKFGFISALMFALEGFGTSDTSYGSGSAKTKYITRPDVSGVDNIYTIEPTIADHPTDTDLYLRYVDNAKLELDFSSGSQSSTITKY
jgi:hypothetical protein